MRNWRMTASCECVRVTKMIKVKVKLSLCLTIYHGMKTYPVLNWAPRLEHVLGSGIVAPRILNLGTRWRCVVRFTTRPLYPRGKSPRYTLDRSLGGLQSRSGRGGEEKNSLNLPEIEPRSSSPYSSHYTDWATVILRLFRDDAFSCRGFVTLMLNR
jgi:hypothetical protein